ncbi:MULTISPECIES: aldehyde dehydrogenase family protein [unclassified Pseudomonas]|uniref:aldehyde dehydrogenase family protein n=1 Tax=unclassified Pseudomonas TaxID=196821 RepID=UPI000C88236B|nr:MULTISPECIES: aldehyde dehydrogenase family protein [unclassified Pseudomonas]PMX27473.1 aldehyde dehydrogenase family protein [Pseudomonas sp. GW460-12]PMX34459.1 aldehyde dehydrogenase family protein [Pseudomonas sp. MPR-R2A4]PMX41866.1 aldehyde dehydrogenase family protein [Pseudomonas sp. MPR-R2A7]PMX53822.1 aldehyde dehydrogenase family protein [Pseudomonas sp. MPR-R2A6]PMX91303.1 aldehyde dehydrogenase family protein [Pseudomonas sp. MPR-R2A3]
MSVVPASICPPESLTPQLAADIRRVFEEQGKTALRLRTSTVDGRIAKLKRLRAVLLAHHEAIVEAAARDFKRPAVEVDFTEMMPVIMDIADYCRRLKKWLKPRRVGSSMMMLGTQAWIRYEPRGRCLIIAPWNYPVTLSLGPLIPAIACGNTAIIKTSEIAPNLSAVLVRIIREVFDESEVAVFEGDASVAEALLDLPFDHCFFTGSPSIGKIVMGAAAKHLTSVTLELGGKSPVIVDQTADIELAAKTIAWGKFINSGQTCIAPDHIYVHRSVKDRFVQSLCGNLDAWYGEGNAAKNAELSRVINVRHTQRIAGLIDDAKARGACVLYGGEVDVEAHFVSPTLIGNIPDDARIMHEEIFGPLLPIISFDGLDEVVERINAAPKPLALYIWTRDQAAADSLIARTSSGGTCVNHIAAHFLHHNLPFGGVNNSGIGSYHGEWGIRAFSHERAIVKTQILLARMFFPPYKPRVRKILGWMLKHF